MQETKIALKALESLPDALPRQDYLELKMEEDRS